TSYTDVWYGDASYGKYGYYDGTKFVYYTNGNMTKTEYETLYHNMLKSVYKNKGFYIGRYEMGIGVADSTSEAQELTRTGLTEYTPSKDKNTSTTVKTNAAPSIEGMNTPVSKANAVGYTYITQSQAQMLAEKLGEGADYSNVNTSIMFGVQWDAVCVFIEKYDKNNTARTKSNWLINSDYGKLWGNYQNSTFNMNRGFYTTAYSSNPVTWNNKANKTSSGNWLCTTGASDQNSSLNIYDFGGNLYEWTLERYSNADYPCSYRGSYFAVNGYASHRGINHTYLAYFDYSARSTLYIK
ncbi:MAG: hypothetical protein HFJ17_00555, partial [Clostridia bacterium]|nr:hypothetical protein [Clostridia bacterium]